MHNLSPLVEAFLIIEQPRQRLSHWISALAPLDDRRAPALAAISAYYDPSCDQALIGLRYDEMALGRDRLAFVVEVALLAELGMIQPAELTESDRRRFLGERLARCKLHVDGERTVTGTLSALVQRIRDAKRTKRTTQEEPILLVNPRGTRDNLQPIRDVHRKQTVQLDPHELARLVESVRPPGQSVIITPPKVIYARYLRSGRWVPVRLGALSLRGASLIANGLPRMHDRVDVAFAYGSHRALVRGPVDHVTTPAEAAQTGASTFRIRFELEEPARRDLTALLKAARAANVTIKPPPARHARRFPVDWPLVLGTPGLAIRGEALDVSREGLFVRPDRALAIGDTLDFSVMLDDDASPVFGRVRVIRHVTDLDAQRTGATPGFGLAIVSMLEADRARWAAFVARIERRADKRVLVGASPGRFNELQSGLAALGYAVIGGTDPGALAGLASTEPRPVDAALIDAGWLTPAISEAWVASLFAPRNVPYVTMRGDVRRARAELDRLLAVV